MKSISGDIHGQVHYTLLSDLGLNSSIEMNNFSINKENKETWFYVNELSSSQIEVAQSVGNTVSGTAVSIGYLCGSPSIHLSFNLAVVLPRRCA